MKTNMNISALESWYLNHQRKLPFRENPSPYFIWVSEIMAQQTQMETVVSYFERFIEKYPTIQDLANTDLDTLLKVVEGIGYYRRFRLMHQTARLIVDQYQGVFPDSYLTVRNLPGVGDYTAGAIMSIAYNQPYAATDGNVIRVLARHQGVKDDMRLPKAKKNINALNQSLIEQATPRIYTQAIMELGALICRPQNPDCDHCPLQNNCVAFNEKITDILPVITPKEKAKTKQFTTLLLEYDCKIALVKNEKNLLNGMYLYPQFEQKNIAEIEQDLKKLGFIIKHINFKAEYRHIFTHQQWLMSVYHLKLESVPINSDLIFVSRNHELPMAIAHKKIVID